MEQTEYATFNVIGAIATVTGALKNSHLKPTQTDDFCAAVKNLSAYFSATTGETWMLCTLVSHYFDNNGKPCGVSALSHFFGCSAIEVLAYKKDMEAILQKGFMRNEESYDGLHIELKNEFVLSGDFIACILENTIPLPIPHKPEEKTAPDMVKKLGRMIEGRGRMQNVTCNGDIMRETEKWESFLQDTEFVKKAKLFTGDDVWLRVFFYDCCYDFMYGNETSLQATIQDVYGGGIGVTREFMAEANALFKNGLIEFTQKESIPDAELTITPYAKELFLGEDVFLFQKSLNGSDVVQPESITEKALFYNEKTEREVRSLERSLQEENLREIQDRLSQKNLPKGITVLLYGDPGTGKTESVFQIARKTGRRILHVDISSSKSCWFGESEKTIKSIFSDYQDLRDRCLREKDGKMPILLFNEADGVFSKRKDTQFSNVAQTENAMQNIILEEMEKLNGILIATTNLESNLDTAFERRFLFKIRFELPDHAAKQKIWKSKLSFLTDDTIRMVSDTFDLSGGQIDNIARKITMNEVLTGSLPNASELRVLCQSERLNDTGRRIGFW